MLKISIGAGVLVCASYLVAVDRTPQQDLAPGRLDLKRSRASDLFYREVQDQIQADGRQGEEGESGARRGSPNAAGYAMMTKLESEGWQFPGWTEGVLPETEWPQEVKDLKPMKVYRAGPDVVFMMSRNGQIERGYYYVMPPSSLSPRSINGWQFLATGGDLWSYTRSLDKR